MKAEFFSLRVNFSTIFEMKIHDRQLRFPIELNDEELGMNKFFDFQSIIEISSCHFFQFRLIKILQIGSWTIKLILKTLENTFFRGIEW